MLCLQLLERHLESNTVEGDAAALTLLPLRPIRVHYCAVARRLASGDSDGNVVVWDVLSGTPLIVLGDLPAAQHLYREYLKGLGSFISAAPDGLPPPGAISALAWIMPKDPLLAVLVAPGLLLLWDTTGAACNRHSSLMLVPLRVKKL